MEANELERRAQRRNALRPLGVDADSERTFVSQIRTVGLESEVLSLPFYPGEAFALQNASGDPLFIVGISDPFGNDPL